MLAFGIELAASLQVGQMVTIDGTLGAGKTTLCRGILAGLGFSGEVQSPTYAIIHSYDPPDTHMPVLHADLYRLRHPDELEELGLLDAYHDSVLLIEWPSHAPYLYELAGISLVIEKTQEGGRLVTLRNAKMR